MRTFNYGVLVAVLSCLSTGMLTEAMPAPLEAAAPHTRVSRSVTNQEEAQDYLQYYQYMAGDGDFWASVSYFQRMAAINQTGILDDKTMEMMNMARCGNVETVGTDSKARRRRYNTLRRWPENEITWRINQFTSDLGQSATVDVMRRALQIWADEANVKFTQVTGTEDVDFNINFVTRAHGDASRGDGPFDGPGGTLAHAFLPTGDARPSLAGDAHFDDDEQYTQNTNAGVNLFQVAAHEFGHSLGLKHSDVEDALMFPFYRGYIANYQLNADDVAGIQYLYGPNVGQPDNTMKPYPVTSNPDVPLTCPGTNVDAFVATNDGRTFALQGKFIWQIEPTGVVDGYPKLISEVFRGLPSDVDAGIYYRYNGFTYFFKGSQCYEYTGTNFVQSGLIRNLWPGLPDNIDAAFVWGRNRKAYFIKGAEYYRFNDNYRRVDSNYPRTLDVWGLRDGNQALLTRVDAAMQWDVNARTYFFSGENYNRFDDYNFEVDASTPYPRSTAFWWFGCDSESYIKGGGSHVAATSAVLITLLAFIIPTLL